MPRTTRTVTFSLPPELADRMDEMTERLGQSRSSLIREATVRYLEDCEWQELLQYGERTARNQGIGVEDVSPACRGVPGRGRSRVRRVRPATTPH